MEIDQVGLGLSPAPNTTRSLLAVAEEAMPESLIPAFKRSQAVAVSRRELSYALADADLPSEPIKIDVSHLRMYVESSSRLWQEENDGAQIPPSQIRDELTAVAHLLRHRASSAALPVPDHPLPITLPAPQNRLDPTGYRDGIRYLEEIEQRLDACLLANMQSPFDLATGLPSNKNARPLTDRAVLGLLVVSMSLECGINNLHEQRALLRALEQPVHATGDFWHLDLQLLSGTGERLEVRRVQLHPLPLAVCLASIERLQQSEEISISLLAGESDSRLNRLLNSCFRALLKELGFPAEHRPRTLSAFNNWHAARLKVQAPPLIEAFSSRDLISHATPLNVFRRMLEFAPLSNQPQNHDEDSDQGGEVELAKADSGASDKPEGHRLAAYHKAQLTELRECTGAAAKKERLAAYVALRGRWQSNADEALTCLAEFAAAMERGETKFGKAMKGRSVKQMLGQVGPSWLTTVGRQPVNELTQADIEGICLDILDHQTSSGGRKRIGRTLRHFLYFLERHGYLIGLDLPDIPRAIGAMAVSANLATPSEAALAATIMQRASPFATLNHGKAAAAMIAIAASCGVRRNEILHARACDFHWSSSSGPNRLLIRPNTARDLKNCGSQRVVALDLAPRWALDFLRSICRGLEPGQQVIGAFLGESEAVYEWRFFPDMNATLKQALGDPGFHYHHLRHSAATWQLLGCLSDELDIARYSERASFIADTVKHAPRIKILLTGNPGPTRKGLTAVSAHLGHAGCQMTLEHYTHCFDLLMLGWFDSSARPGQAKRVAAVLNLPLRTVQNWYRKGAVKTCRHIEKSIKTTALIERDDTPLRLPDHVERTRNRESTLFDRLNQHWMRLEREQSYRIADPGRRGRSVSPQLGKMIEALYMVDAIETDKRGSHVNTLALDDDQAVKLPPPLGGAGKRGTALKLCGMLEDAFMDDLEATRRAVRVWAEHSGKIKGYFRLNADVMKLPTNEGLEAESSTSPSTVSCPLEPQYLAPMPSSPSTDGAQGAFAWLICSPHISDSWVEFAARDFVEMDRMWDSEIPEEAYYARLSRPGHDRTERSAIRWVIAMTYALIMAGFI